MNDLDLAGIEDLANAATAGPWHAITTGVRGGDHWFVCDEGEAIASISAQDGINEEQRGPDAEFIARARTAVPDMVSEIRRLRQELSEANVDRMSNRDNADRALAKLDRIQHYIGLKAGDRYHGTDWGREMCATEPLRRILNGDSDD